MSISGRSSSSKSSKTKVKGVKGLENKYNQQLNNTHDGILKGERDVSSKISFNKKSISCTETTLIATFGFQSNIHILQLFHTLVAEL